MRTDRPDRRGSISADGCGSCAPGGFWQGGLQRLAVTALSAVLLVVLVAGGRGEAQDGADRDVVSSRIALSSAEASVRLELSGDEPLEIVFRDGRVLVGEEMVGDYRDGEALESSWRELLGRVAGLAPARLAGALAEWEPPSDLDGEARRIAERIDSTLESRLAVAAGAATDAAPTGERPGIEQVPGFERLLTRPERLRLLASALEGVDLGNVRVRVDEDLAVPEGEELDGSAIVVEGDLDVGGTLQGDAVVVGGTLRLGENGRITGDVRLADAGIERDGGTIDGTVTPVSEPSAATAPASDPSPAPAPDVGGDDRDLRDAIRDEIREEIRDRSRGRSSGSSAFSALRNVGSGLLGLIQNLIGFGIALALSALAIRFAPDHLDRVTEAARRTPGRAAVVGVAGFFLLFPAYVLGILALSLSIIGIPALLLWVPLFPLAASLAAAFGYLAVARLLGEWITRQRFQSLRFLRASNTLHCLAAGLAALILPFAAAHVVEIGGNWLDVLRGLLIGVGWLGGFVALSIGFGAVLLTRGGRVPGGGFGPGSAGGGFGSTPTPPPPEGDPAERWSDPRPGEGGGQHSAAEPGDPATEGNAADPGAEAGRRSGPSRDAEGPSGSARSGPGDGQPLDDRSEAGPDDRPDGGGPDDVREPHDG